MRQVLRFLKEEEGPTALEYAIVLSLIFIAAIVAIAVLGQNTNESIDSSAGSIGKAVAK